MGLFLLRFWPVLIPLVVYWIWLRRIGRKALIEGKPVLRFRDGPWYWAVLSSMLTAGLCFAFIGASMVSEKGGYVPAHIENGTIIPGKVVP